MSEFIAVLVVAATVYVAWPLVQGFRRGWRESRAERKGR